VRGLFLRMHTDSASLDIAEAPAAMSCIMSANVLLTTRNRRHHATSPHDSPVTSGDIVGGGAVVTSGVNSDGVGVVASCV
jgi:hypothetical protein